MINIRSAKQMDLARIETLYNHIHDEEVGIVPCVFNGIPDVQLVCLEKYRRRLSPYCSVASLYFWSVAGGAIPGMKDFAPKKQKRSSNPCRNDSLAASGI